MLDDTVDVPSTDSSTEAPKAPRRRRAVSRPSGPPDAIVVSAPAVEPPAPAVEAPAPALEPSAPAAKRPPRAPRTRKAANPDNDEVAGGVTTSDAAAQAPRARRTRSKAPAAAAVAPVDAPERVQAAVAPVQAAPVQAEPAAAHYVAQPIFSNGVEEAIVALEGTRPPRRRRSASRPAGAPAPIDLDAIVAALVQPVQLEQPVVAEEPEDVEAIDDEEVDAVIDAADEDGLEEDDLVEDGSDGDTPLRRRRRRRGGRRRRRGPDAGDVDPDAVSEDEPEGESDEDEEPEGDETEAVDGEEPVASGSRRRRRRRRRGEDTTAAEDDPTDVVVRVREPRGRRRPTPAAPSDEVTGIEGSTRMEAKRQRRRDGRAAGRRRAPILSEAEFLARRESVERVMLVRQKDDLSQIAVIEDGVLVEHYVDRASATSLIGNVYVGKIQNVLPSMEAAFVDIGRGRNAVLYAGEVDWDAFGAEGQSRQVEKVFSSGQSVLVQVTKDPVGAKGARLTAHISLPGRYLVYAPGGHLSGISRKLPEQERNRLKDILGDLVADDASVIIRTAAEGVTEEELVRDITRLKAQWDSIEKKVKQGSAPQALYSEPDLTVRIVRDLFTEDFTQLVVDGNGQSDDAFDTVSAYVAHVAPHLAGRVSTWNHESDGDLFGKNRIDEQIAKALERKVFLPSGGSLIIDRTEAMTVIDVNTGKFTGSGGNLEATVTANNLEAAEEIVRQLRLRDIGGIIVMDFIDMVLPSNRDLLLRRLVECLGRDRTRHQVAEVTSLGLVQMTRKKIGTGLAEAFTEPCEACHGRGYHRHDEPVETQAPADGGDRRRRRS
ncbi:MAG: Rne/Rng family ribonuclease [Propionibacteriaceae bacterium]